MLSLSTIRTICATVGLAGIFQGINLSQSGEQHEVLTYTVFYGIGGALLFTAAVLTVVIHRRGQSATSSEPAAFETTDEGETVVEGGSVRGYKRVSRAAGGIARFIDVKIRRR